MEWASAYAVTLLVEVPLVVALMRAAGWVPRDVDGGFSWPGALLLAWALNLTHPVLWWIGPGSVAGVLVAEVLIFLVEGMVLGLVAARVTRSPAPGITVAMGLLIAFAANFASFALGLGLYHWGLLPG
ncbi:MAG: hypothetical protein Q4G35_00040 [Propionibacteriaceae bacterium]|nr:hypothetical protein [Propionibacteriaceae bacterium]